MALFNGIATTNSTVTPGGANASGDFSAAMASIGSALGELRSGIEKLPANIEKAFISAISSDAANESIYDAVASASYDAITDVHADRGMVNGIIPSAQAPKPGNGNIPGRSFSLKELLSSSAGKGDAGDMKRMRDLQENFLANLAPDFYKKGARVFDKILAGDMDAASIADSLGAMDIDGDDGGGGFLDTALSMLGAASHLLPGRRGKGNHKNTKEKKNKKSRSKGGSKNVQEPDNKKGNKKTQKGDNKKAQPEDKKPKQQQKESPKKEPPKKQPPKKTPTGPKSQTAKSGTKAVGKTGTKAASKAGSKAAGNVAAKAGAKVAAKTGAKVAAKTALRAVPVVGQVAGAAMLAYDVYQIGKGVKELAGATEESKKNIAAMQEANLSNFAETQKGKAGAAERTAAYAKTQETSKRLHEIQNSTGVLAFANDEKANTALQEYRDIMSGKVKMEGAEEGTELDKEAVKKYVLSKIKGIGSGWTKDLADALIDNQAASDAYNEVLRNTSPNGQKNDGQTNVQDVSGGVPGQPLQFDAKGVPLAPGSMENKAQDIVTAGTGVMTMDVMTAEQQFQQYRQFTFEGIRDALLLPEVRDMFTTTAQTAGSAVEKKLMG